VRDFDNPETSYNWRAWALGDPVWLGLTGIAFLIDRNADGQEDNVVYFYNDGSGVVAVVTPANDPSRSLCAATPSWSGSSRTYRAKFPASCIGSPAGVRVRVYMYYETASTISEDITSWSSTAARPAPPAGTAGYWMVGQTGIVYAFGSAQRLGNAAMAGVVDLEPTPSGGGYWIVNRTGEVQAFGDARWFGNAVRLRAGETVSSISSTQSGAGYWLFTNRGRVLVFGDAKHYGGMGDVPLNGPVLGSITTETGKGYYMVASDGGIFAFGDAKFYGSMGGQRLNAPVMSLVPDADGTGYWLVAFDGGIFAFQAPFRGSMGATQLNQPVIGMVQYGNGYLMVASDGGIFNFSNQPFLGSLGASPPAVPIVSVAAVS
jgi:ribosomal protein L24E